MSIYKKQSDDVKTFDSAEEFLKYYDNNRKDIDNTHTRSLNLKFKINGHHLGRKGGNLILYPLRGVDPKGYPVNKVESYDQTNDDSDLNQKYEQLKQAVLDLNERLKIIEAKIMQQSSYHLSYHK